MYPRSDQKTAIQFLDYVIARLPFQIEKIQTDNGAEFQSACHWHVIDQGIGHGYIRSATPRLSGKVERSHRIDAEEFYSPSTVDSHAVIDGSPYSVADGRVYLRAGHSDQDAVPVVDWADAGAATVAAYWTAPSTVIPRPSASRAA
jgi:hypothetical protein